MLKQNQLFNLKVNQPKSKPSASLEPKRPESKPEPATEEVPQYLKWQNRSLPNPEVGMRVVAVTEEYGEVIGTITYIDWPTFYAPHLFPIQLELNKPVDSSNQRMLRVCFNQVKEYLHP